MQCIGKTATIGRYSGVFDRFPRDGAVGGDVGHLHVNQLLIRRAGVDRDATAHGNLHHPADRQRSFSASDVGGQPALERHLRDRRTIDHVDPEAVDPVVATDDVEADVGQNVVERVGIFLKAVFRAARHAASIHSGPATMAPFGPITHFDHLGHMRHRRVGPGDDFQFRSTRNLLYAAGKPLDFEPCAARPKLVGKGQRATRPDMHSPRRQNGEQHHAEGQQSGGKTFLPQWLWVEYLLQIDLGNPLGGLAARSGEHPWIDFDGFQRSIGQCNGRQEAVVQMRETAFQHRGRVAVGDVDEGPAADPMQEDRRQHNADRAKRGAADPNRRFKEPIDRQGGPKRHAQPHQGRCDALDPHVAADATAQVAQHRLHGRSKRRSVGMLGGRHGVEFLVPSHFGRGDKYFMLISQVVEQPTRSKAGRIGSSSSIGAKSLPIGDPQRQ